MDKRLREEQDREFQASLEADKAKKREREQQQVVEPLNNGHIGIRQFVLIERLSL